MAQPSPLRVTPTHTQSRAAPPQTGESALSLPVKFLLLHAAPGKASSEQTAKATLCQGLPAQSPGLLQDGLPQAARPRPHRRLPLVTPQYSHCPASQFSVIVSAWLRPLPHPSGPWFQLHGGGPGLALGWPWFGSASRKATPCRRKVWAHSSPHVLLAPVLIPAAEEMPGQVP